LAGTVKKQKTIVNPKILDTFDFVMVFILIALYKIISE
jgi:hypothetical protein